MKKKTILVTCAFPYSNGPIHLGHLLEHIQADIWVRYRKMKGEEVLFMSSDDSHGAAIMLKAIDLDMDPSKMIQKMHKEHKEDLLKFSISHDIYCSTNDLENKNITQKIYLILKKRGYIKKKIVSQLYDSEKKFFLPDRFVKGNCPNCLSPDQYGDNCEICGVVYNSTDLLHPRSILSQSPLKIKKTKHIFLILSKFQKKLFEWINCMPFSQSVKNKSIEWISKGLKDWDISRDDPYFGFKIPEEKRKYFYVWLDATIGYIASSRTLFKKRKISFQRFWKNNSEDLLFHFIGKDIIYFHTLFWPSILEGIKYRKPNNIFVHGHLTVDGQKMSKSKGNFISANSYLKHFDSDYLRYYFASKLSSKFEDVNFNLTDFSNKINKELINKIINLASRNASFIKKYFCNYLSKKLDNMFLYQKFIKESKKIEQSFISLNFNSAVKRICFLSDLANKYVEMCSPWKIDPKLENKKMHEICSTGINLFKILMTYLSPILPKIAERSSNFLNYSFHHDWNSLNNPLLNHKINDFKSLASRIDLNGKIFLKED
ncbi:methionine--tRNA ligase [Candidatus Riesia pediculicola]|uniref:Methionine--tRNA ligase n=1 Tax=Riesia pediculicola (strain USDA) TaxID=515618 RepID=D4G8Z5_RIEPU|nr:methionine--tRNA ligase [Candidatus Riesia pediculicola]ADD79823.1 methionyl-tRNA synthetase [Candidatus Riesia pediculicola USDA]ARC54003.1 methionine--tRNA ligase [Candidatus Riesia pediculicola]QOJ86629.1 methionine--tRNA ligase [Candidatus Riesia pediculicola]